MSDLDFIFFGDSLTDPTAIHDLTTRTTIVTIPSPNLGYGRAFSNGDVHADVLTDLLGAASANYAVGGAKALGSLTFEQYVDARIGAQDPGLDVFLPGASLEDLGFDLHFGAQIGRYLSDAAATPPAPGTVAGIFIGLNDYSEFVPSSPETAPAEAAALVQAVVTATISGAAAVAATGVETIALYTMPNFRLFPFSQLQAPEALALGDAVIAAHNAGLVQGAALLEAEGANVEFIDVNRITAEVRADPTTFGFRPELMLQPTILGTGGNPVLVEQPDGSYLGVYPTNPAVAGVDPDQIPFWDLIHPSAALHGVLGVFSAESLTSDTVFLTEENDSHAGTLGDDLVLGGAGNDLIHTRSGNDVILAGTGDDLASGGRGADIVAGGSGRDLLFGGRGDDVLADGAGSDRSVGGAGRDLLIDGLGQDLLCGGAGADAFVFVAATLKGQSLDGNGGRFHGGAGRDTLYLVVDDALRTVVEAEIVDGAKAQTLASIDVRTCGIERLVLLGPDDALDIAGGARVDEADLWGLI